MNKVATTLLIVLIAVNSGWAQRGRDKDKEQRHARIHAAKVAYITDRLKLSTEQSGKFIPVYNEYEQEIKELRKTFIGKYKGSDRETNETTSRQYIDDNLDYQQQVIELKRRYNERFLNAISARQLADLYKAEREFKEKLLQRLEERRGGRNK